MCLLNDQRKTPICTAIQKHILNGPMSFHMPGHKNGSAIPSVLQSWGDNVWKWDLTELPGLDNLRYPQSVIFEAEALAAALYGVKRTFFLTQGSTCGLMAALLAVLKPGQAVLIPRNSHVSIINGLVLADVCPIYMPIDVDSYGMITGVNRKTLRHYLQTNDNVAAVVLVHPSYDGRSLDIANMVNDIHEAGLPAIIDEAHGAHLHFHPNLPVSSVDCGADVVVQSAHKTLAALTGAAWIHLQGTRVQEKRLEAALHLLHTTSPSYLTLASLDAARFQLASEGYEKLESIRKKIVQFMDHMRALKQIIFLNKVDDGHDFTKMTLHFMTKNVQKRVNILQEEGIWPEKWEGNNILFLTSLADEHQDWGALEKILEAMDLDLQQDYWEPRQLYGVLPAVNCTMRPRKVFFAEKEWILLNEADGRVAGVAVMLYPPGVPIILPGELITSDVIIFILNHYKEQELKGLRYLSDIYIHVVV